MFSHRLPSILCSLTDNRIGNEGAQALAAVLTHTSLHTINFKWNEIGDEGAQALAAVLSQTSIHTLTLDHNDIGEEVAWE